MHIPANYFQDKWVLALLAANGALALLAIANVLLNDDTELNSLSIVQYRDSRAIQVSGPTSDLYQFAIFAAIVTVVMTALSVKLYTLRKHLSISLLGLNVVLLVLCMVVFNALTRTL